MTTSPTRPRAQGRRKQAAAPVAVPQSRDEVIAHIAEIGVRGRELARLRAAMNDELARIKEGWEQRAAVENAAIEALSEGVQIWCEAHRATLTKNGKIKTARFASGEVAWRTRPPAVRLTGVGAVIDALARARLKRFLREKVEVNKEAILAEPEAVRDIPGIAIVQGEDFVITPFEAELAESGQ